jgi:hypothetical protein
MFDEAESNTEKDTRSRWIMIASGAAVLVVLVLIIIVASQGSKESASEPPMPQRGSPEFESYAQSVNIIITRDDKMTAKNLLGNNIGILRAKVQNSGDRELVGLQLRAVALGLDNETLSEKIITPVPRIRESLKPQETMQVDVHLDRIPDPQTIMEMTIELYALKLK